MAFGVRWSIMSLESFWNAAESAPQRISLAVQTALAH